MIDIILLNLSFKMFLLLNFIIKNVCLFRSVVEGWKVIVVVLFDKFLEFENGFFVNRKFFRFRVNNGIRVEGLKLILIFKGLNDFIL